MSGPRFMVFKLKDLWVPVIVTIIAILMVVFFVSRLTVAKPTFAPQEDYTDGVYVAKISLDNADFNVAVSIHKNSITAIELRNMDEKAKLMYPLFEPSIAYINDHVTKTQSLDIPEFTEAKQTTAFLMGAVKDALSISENTADMMEMNTEDEVITNPDMSDQAYVDWELEIDALFENETELELE